MTHNDFLGAAGWGEDDGYQFSLMPATTSSSDLEVWFSSSFGSHGDDVLQVLHQDSMDPVFIHEPVRTSSFICGRPVSSAQISTPSRFIQREITGTTTLPPLTSQGQSHMRTVESVYDMRTPQTIVNQAAYRTIPQPYCQGLNLESSNPSYSPDSISPRTSSPPSSFTSSPAQFYPQPIWPQALLVSTCGDSIKTPDENIDQHEGLGDKPYAQLIYQALMQAPGRRMLLRDIYKWFIRNTSKPIESGTNGWQNSIRHNLSMNQAFENDKNDPAANRGARKANSVWVLTEDAIRHGVQSTTRYRKNNLAKRGTGSRVPAVQRQRSGARGGRAAKRAARLKRSGEAFRNQTNGQCSHESSSPFSFSNETISTPQDEWPLCKSYSPPTPEADQSFISSYHLPRGCQTEEVGEGGVKHETEACLVEDSQIRQMLCWEDSEELLRNMITY